MSSAHSTQWRVGTTAKTIPGATNISDIDEASYEDMTAPLDRLLSNFRENCVVSYASTSTVTVGAGEIVLQNSGGTITLMQQNAAATTVTWGMIDTGSEAASTTYYLWAYQATATDTDFDVTISTSSSAPSGKTYYAKLGQFYNNSSSNIEQVENDDYVANVLIATGTVVDGATISLPSGYASSQCKWTVSINALTRWSGGSDTAWTEACSVDSDRVVTITRTGWSSSTGTANYMIIGVK